MHGLTGKQPDPSQEFFVVRHAQDNDILSTELNQSLISGSLDQINGLALYIKAMFTTEAFTITYGPSKRTSQTAQHLAKILLESGYTVNLEEDIDIKEFYQGQFCVDHSLLSNGKYLPLETAWKIFNAKVANDEVLYKFGDPVINNNGKPAFPLLQSFFTKYGETQSDFLFRIRRFVSRIGNSERLSNHLNVVVTHQAVASRIQREITGKRMQLGYCEGVPVPYPSI